MKVSDIHSSASSETDKLSSMDEDSEKYEQKTIKEILPRNLKAGFNMLPKFKT